MDVDGVLTDGTVWLDETGREIEADLVRRHHGRLASAGAPACSSPGLRRERRPASTPIAAKFGIADVYPRLQGQGGRASATSRRGTASSSTEICFIGDDVNDVAAMEICGLAVAPAEAHAAAAAAATMVTTPARRHGRGARGHRPSWLGWPTPASHDRAMSADEALRLRHAGRRRAGRQARVHAARRRGDAPRTSRSADAPTSSSSPTSTSRPRRSPPRPTRRSRTTWASRMVTTGPGGTNAVTGVASAWLDSMPCLVLSGQVKRADLKRDSGVRILGVQEIDIVSIVAVDHEVRGHDRGPVDDPVPPREGGPPGARPAAAVPSGSTSRSTSRRRQIDPASRWPDSRHRSSEADDDLARPGHRAA